MTAHKRPGRKGAKKVHAAKADQRRPQPETRVARFIRTRRPELILFAVALGLRLLVLVELSDCPSFAMPLVDSEIYDRAARGLAEGRGLGEAFYFQPFLYPFSLGVVYALTGSSIIAAKVVQALVGAITCALVAFLGARLFDRTTGLLAGGLTAIYGPLLFFETELVATGWTAFWSVLLPLLLLVAERRPSRARLLVTGACCGLAVLTRPTFLPFVMAAIVWLGIRVGRRDLRALLATIALIVVGFLSVAMPVAWSALTHTGEFRFLPASGGFNLFLGNNPDRCATLTIRPGQEWQEVVTSPRAAGAEGLWEEDRWFRSQVMEFMVQAPGACCVGIAEKAVEFVSSREIPRNIDIYFFRQWSTVLRATVWKFGGFGFPFGVLFPLAALGVIVGWRRLTVPVALYLVLYPLAVVVVFVSARYRAPVVPVMAIAAAAGVMWLVRAVGAGGRGKGVAVAVAVMAVALLVSVVPGPFCQEEDLEGEYWFLMTAAYLRNGETAAAEEALGRAIELEPDSFETRYQLGVMLLDRGEVAEAAVHLQRAVALRPDLSFGHRELGTALGRLGNAAGARVHLESALSLVPDDVRTLNSLGALSAQEGDFGTAKELFERAMIIDPAYQPARKNLEYVLRELDGVDVGGQE